MMQFLHQHLPTNFEDHISTFFIKYYGLNLELYLLIRNIHAL